MELPPDHYVDTVPCDKEPLTELGRVSWAAARLHAGVRDAIDRHDGAASDEPFTKTLGQAVKMLEVRAPQASRVDQVEWVTSNGRPAVRMRNRVVHAVTYTAPDGRQSIGTLDHWPSGRFLSDESLASTLHLVHASMTLPA